MAGGGAAEGSWKRAHMLRCVPPKKSTPHTPPPMNTHHADTSTHAHPQKRPPTHLQISCWFSTMYLRMMRSRRRRCPNPLRAHSLAATLARAVASRTCTASYRRGGRMHHECGCLNQAAVLDVRIPDGCPSAPFPSPPLSAAPHLRGCHGRCVAQQLLGARVQAGDERLGGLAAGGAGLGLAIAIRLNCTQSGEEAGGCR